MHGSVDTPLRSQGGVLDLAEGADACASHVGASVDKERRLSHLDTIRGLAALQVVLLHELSAFFPNVVFGQPNLSLASLIHYSPLYFLYDGYSAVYMFFVLSGYVLTPMFARYADHPSRLLLGRWFRLGVPAFFACLLSAVIYNLFGTLHVKVSLQNHSGWLVDAWHPLSGLGYFWRDLFVQALLVGYKGASIDGGTALGHYVMAPGFAYVPPFWTLSAEIQGSIFVLGLAVLAQQANRGIALLCAGIFGILLGQTYLFPFILGFMLAEFDGISIIRRFPGFVLLLIAIVGLSLNILEEYIPNINDITCLSGGKAGLPCAVHLPKIYGSCLVFMAILGSAKLETILSGRPLLWIGKLSFPIYLVHWPLVLGVGSAIYLAVSNGRDTTAPAVIAVVASLALTLLAARLFAPLDLWAVRGSRWLRGKSAT